MRTDMYILMMVVGWMLAIFIAVLGGLVIYYILTGKIRLTGLLDEEGGDKASMGRFQFLVFTFVIALSLFLVIASSGGADGALSFPDIPAEIFALLGISGGSFLVSKGIKSNQDTQLREYEVKKEHERTLQKALEKGVDPNSLRQP